LGFRISAQVKHQDWLDEIHSLKAKKIYSHVIENLDVFLEII
jgi:hypothetical protein